MNNLKLLIGKKIRKLRKSKNLTQEKLAELLGIGTPNISYIENGKFAPSIETLEKLANIFEIEPYEIYMCSAEKNIEEIKDYVFKNLNSDEETLRLVYKFMLTIK